MKTNCSIHTPRRLPLAVAILVTLSCLPAMAAMAQDSESPAKQEASSKKVTTFDTVTVTANKRSQDVREVPASISVLGGEQLENQHANQLTDFAAYVPGLQVESGGSPGQSMISLRGVAPVGPGATVATYIDEVPVGSSSNYGAGTNFQLDLLPYDIERIEILRGPQGTLYGAGAMGGLIKYVTRDPDLNAREFRLGGGLSTVSGGSTGWDTRLGANLPLVEDKLALRVGYSRNNQPGYIDNVTSGRRDTNKAVQESARVAALWKPSETVNVRLAAMRQTIDSHDNGAVELNPADYKPRFGDLKNSGYLPETFEKTINYYSGTLDWDLGWATLTSASGYSKVFTSQMVDATLIYGALLPLFGEPAGKSGFDLRLDLEKITQEFRLTSSGDGPFAWQVGAFYTDEDSSQDQIVSASSFAGVPVAGLDPMAVIGLPSKYKETALFADASYAFSEQFTLGAGLRQSRNKQTYRETTSGPLVGDVDNPGLSNENVTTWMLSPQFHLDKDTMVYARVATGYRPGGPNISVPGVPPSVKADTLTNYEIGVKTDLLDRRLTLDVAAYRINWKDIQVTGNNGIQSYLVNGGTAVSQGLEVATVFRPSRAWRFGFNAAYTDATLTEDAPSIQGMDGDRLPYIPKASWSATADYMFTAGSWAGRVGGGYRWVGKRYNRPTSSPNAEAMDQYAAIDLNADLSNDRWTLRAYVKNLADKRSYLTYASYSSALTGETVRLQGIPVQPRTIGVEFDYRF